MFLASLTKSNGPRGSSISFISHIVSFLCLPFSSWEHIPRSSIFMSESLVSLLEHNGCGSKHYNFSRAWMSKFTKRGIITACYCIFFLQITFLYNYVFIMLESRWNHNTFHLLVFPGTIQPLIMKHLFWWCQEDFYSLYVIEKKCLTNLTFWCWTQDDSPQRTWVNNLTSLSYKL